MIPMLLSFYGNTRSLSVYVENLRFAYGSKVCISSDMWCLFSHFLYKVSYEKMIFPLWGLLFSCVCVCVWVAGPVVF